MIPETIFLIFTGALFEYFGLIKFGQWGATCPRSDLVGDAETAFTSPEPRSGAEIVALRGQAMSWYLLK